MVESNIGWMISSMAEKRLKMKEGQEDHQLPPPSKTWPCSGHDHTGLLIVMSSSGRQVECLK